MGSSPASEITHSPSLDRTYRAMSDLIRTHALRTVDPARQAEINAARKTSYPTLRPTAPTLEAILQHPFAVLDHGFLRVIDYMGDDSSIVRAARVSYGRGTRQVSEDRQLIQYLMRHQHSTPFEMCEIILHVKLPIFVARQWIRHRTASVNEYSARYSILDKEFYIPDPAQLAVQSTTNRQGRGDVLDPDTASRVLDMLRADAERCYDTYASLIDEPGQGRDDPQASPGLARELARINLTLNTYTQWQWKTDLRNLLHFLRLRVDRHAQYEIRVYAEILLDIVRAWVPLAYDAFVEHQLNAVTLSATMLDVVRRRLAGETVTRDTTTLSQREWADLTAMLDQPRDSLFRTLSPGELATLQGF